MKMADVKTLVEMLQVRAVTSPISVLSWIGEGVDATETMTATELDRDARGIAARLQAEGIEKGDRVLLFYPAGPEFVRALFGCFYAGGVAVPVYPPNPARLGRTLPRVRKIAGDCKPRFVLASAAIRESAKALLPVAPELAACQWVASDTERGDPAAWKAPELGASDLALLQYTSGSTRAPRGVMLTNANLLHNQALLAEGFAVKPNEGFYVSWLPMYHDMGLIGKLFTPLHLGLDLAFMSPIDFMQDPYRWLGVISKHAKGRPTLTGSPNFGYELCVRKITDEQVATLDLSSLRVAFCGAEPVRASTYRAFTEKFAKAGLKSSAFLPCYGLAEASLIVSGKYRPEPIILNLDADKLREGKVVRVTGKTDFELVGCGPFVGKQDGAIVSPEGERLGPELIGEIWVRGDSIGQGYWGDPPGTSSAFTSKLKDGTGPFLNTGDLGFVDANGELFITGRSKDLIIVRGLNYYPHDIEAAAEAAHPGIRPGCSVAFAVQQGGTEGVGLVCEFDVKGPEPVWSAVVDSVVAAVAESHEIAPRLIVFVKSRQVPKTPSGKVQRSLTRKMLDDGELEVLHKWEAPEAADEGTGNLEGLSSEAPLRTAADVTAFLCEWLTDYLGRDVTATTSFVAMGLDSLATVQLMEAFSSRVGQEISAMMVIDYETIAELAPAVVELLEPVGDGPAEQAVALGDTPILRGAGPALSYEQEAMVHWLTTRPKLAVWNLSLCARAKGTFVASAFERAMREVLRRHQVLRYAVTGDVKRPGLTLLEPGDIPIDLLEVTPGADVEEELKRITLERQEIPFAADGKPLIRIAFVKIGPDEGAFTMSWHGLVSDVGIRGPILRELWIILDAQAKGAEPELPEPLQHADFATWQRVWTEGAGAPRVAGARARIRDARVVEIPSSKKRPERVSGEAIDTSYKSNEGTVQAMVERCTALNVTPFGALLGVLGLVLRCAADQTALTIISVTTQRNLRPELERAVGNYGNVVLHTLDLGGVASVRDVMLRAHASTLDALQYHDVHTVPTLERVDCLDSPLCRVMLNGPNLFGEGGGGGPRERDEVRAVRLLQRQFLPPKGIRNELVFSGHQFNAEGVYGGWVNGAADVFDTDVVERLRDAFVGAIESFCGGAELPAMTEVIKQAWAKKA